MLVFLTHRRLKPGAYEEFRRAWEPEGGVDRLARLGVPEQVYHARSLTDPDEIVSFGIADVDAGDLDRIRAGLGGEEAEQRRQERLARTVASTGVDAVFEVIEHIAVGDRATTTTAA